MLSLYRITALCFLLLLPAWAQAATVVVLGDSLSAAYGIGQDQGWVTLLSSRLQHRDPGSSVFNASISGETSAGGLNRLTEIIKRHDPEILIIELGANDGLRGLPIDQLNHNLTKMIRYCHDRHIDVLLVGIQLPGNYGVQYNLSLQQTYQDLADKFRIPLVPLLFDGLKYNADWFQNDGLHPNARAQPVILDTIWHMLEPMLDKR